MYKVNLFRNIPFRCSLIKTYFKLIVCWIYFKAEFPIHYICEMISSHVPHNSKGWAETAP